MAGRALAFSDPEIIRLVNDSFIPVAADDWYERRRQDEVGKFFRQVADQSPRKGEGGQTRQGIYLFTAGGKLLEYKNAGQNPSVMLEMFRNGLRKWQHLPEAETRAGSVSIPAHPPNDPIYTRLPPPQALVLSVFTRVLEKGSDGELRQAPCRVGAGNEAGIDHLWITESEWRHLFSAGREGTREAMPRSLAERLIRFHLVDDTRGEPPFWKKEDLREYRLETIVEKVTSRELVYRVEGTARLLTHERSPDERGYNPAMIGRIVVDRDAMRVRSFELCALGEHWGEGPHTKGARSGKTPLGVFAELADGGVLVPPQGSREINDYLGRQ